MIGEAIGAGVGIGGSVLQYINSRNALKNAQEQQAKVEEALRKVQDPNFDMSQFTPEEYSLVGQYAPQMLPMVEQRAPQLVGLSDTGKQGQDAMLGALQRLRSIGQGGPDAQSQAMIAQAQQQAAIQNQGQQASIIDSMSRRGAAPGSGLEFAAALNSQQGSNQAASQSGTNAALNAYQQRLQALKDSAGIGNQVANNDLSISRSNSDIINNFNQNVAAMQNQNAQYNTGNLNDAQRSNLGARQQVADQNVGLRNNAVAQKNQLAQQQYQNALQKVGVQAGVSQQNANNGFTGAAQQNAAIQGATQGLAAGATLAGNYFGNKSGSQAPAQEYDFTNRKSRYA